VHALLMKSRLAPESNKTIAGARSEKTYREDLLALGNILHGTVVDATGLRNSHPLRTTWWRDDAALRGHLLRRGALPSEVARATTVAAGVARSGSSGRWC
jgi:hypothetical protein